MHPVLFEIPMPGFLKGLAGATFTVYSYGFFIVIGAMLGVSYVAYQTKKRYNLSFDAINTFFLLLLIAAIAGGKVFLFFERPSYYLHNLNDLLTGRGFVFYGSLLFTIPTMLYFFNRYKLPVLAMLDIMAITTCIVHLFGRTGCFMAGCCHGTAWDGPFAVIFTDPACLAPLGQPLHPTQWYSFSLILIILAVLFVIKKYKQFEGQLFLLYLMLYAIGRSVVELFRGDISRGFIIEEYLSHSQFISLLVFIASAYFYIRLYKNKKLVNTG